MADGRKRHNKLYRKVRNGSSWGSVILCLLLTVLFIGLVIFLSGFFLQYLLENKLAEGYHDIEKIADIYAAADDNNALLDYLKDSKIPFFVKDKSGNVLYQVGKNTCSDETGYFNMANGKDRIKVYTDAKERYLYPKKDGTPGFDAIKALTGLDKDANEVRLPIWMSVEIKGGTQYVIGKTYFTFNLRDTTLAGEVILFAVLVILIIFTLMIVFIIRSIVNYRRVVRLYYSDAATNAKNWAWFARYGEDKIRSFRYRRNSYAVVNLSFSNYHNYCMCHSIAAGDALLAKFNKALIRKLRSGELCARAATSRFALLLTFADEETIRMRLFDMMNALQNVEIDHIFVLQAGVDVVYPVTNAAGKIVKRKEFNIEKTYNNACSATIEMIDTDISDVKFFDTKLLEDQRWVDTVTAHQNRALTNQEFVVYYQPKYNPQSLELNGAEALIRWNSPEYGFVTPGRFIPIFEKNGFITAIDDFMIWSVAADQKCWLDAGYRVVPVSVNVSRAHFADKDLATHIRDLVDSTGCPHNFLEIELTESAFFDDKNAMINTIKALKSYGFMVSMDDFGSGYSSLNSLKDMPLDVLKLDADFFRGEKGGDRADIVVAEAIKHAKNLSMMTVAEGVEDKDQVEFLARQGCDMIQGYYFAKPMPKNEYVVKLPNIYNASPAQAPVVAAGAAGAAAGAGAVGAPAAAVPAAPAPVASAPVAASAAPAAPVAPVAAAASAPTPDQAQIIAQIQAQTAQTTQVGMLTGADAGLDAITGIIEQAAPEVPQPVVQESAPQPEPPEQPAQPPVAPNPDQPQQ